jgi:hypothetical protein
LTVEDVTDVVEMSAALPVMVAARGVPAGVAERLEEAVPPFAGVVSFAARPAV